MTGSPIPMDDTPAQRNRLRRSFQMIGIRPPPLISLRSAWGAVREAERQIVLARQTLGRELRDAREVHGLSARSAALCLVIDDAYLGRMEKATAHVSEWRYRMFLEFYEMSDNEIEEIYAFASEDGKKP